MPYLFISVWGLIKGPKFRELHIWARYEKDWTIPRPSACHHPEMIADPRHGGGVSDEQKPRRFLKADIQSDCLGSRYQKLRNTNIARHSFRNYPIPVRRSQQLSRMSTLAHMSQTRDSFAASCGLRPDICTITINCGGGSTEGTKPNSRNTLNPMRYSRPATQPLTCKP